MTWHRHKWRAVGANLYSKTAAGYEAPRLFTRVLYACECGAREVKEFEGHWKLKDFQDGEK